MSGPNPVLMHYYGNEEMYRQKLAAEGMVRLASIAAGAGADMAKKTGIARKALLAAAAVGYGYWAYKGINKAREMMGRETSPSIAAGAGADMAKKAGIIAGAMKGAVTDPIARKALGVAAVAGGGYLAYKGINKAQEMMGRETSPTTYGGGRFGYTPAMGINEYGQPQAGTPLM